MPTTIELPAEVEEILEAVDACFEAGIGRTPMPLEAAALLNRLDRELRQMPIFQSILALARKDAACILCTREPQAIFNIVYQDILTGFTFGRIYGRLDKAAEYDGGDD